MEKNEITVELTHPVEKVKGEEKKTIKSVTITEPDSGNLRGLQLSMIMVQDMDTMFELLPRITKPQLTKTELHKLRASDLLKLSSGVLGFFVSE